MCNNFCVHGEALCTPRLFNQRLQGQSRSHTQLADTAASITPKTTLRLKQSRPSLQLPFPDVGCLPHCTMTALPTSTMALPLVNVLLDEGAGLPHKAVLHLIAINVRVVLSKLVPHLIMLPARAWQLSAAYLKLQLERLHPFFIMLSAAAQLP